ncbi:MAG: hypothetical protein ACK5QX_06610, partial [bacterium]
IPYGALPHYTTAKRMKKNLSKNNFILRLFIKAKRQVCRPTFLCCFTGFVLTDSPINFKNDATKLHFS